MPGYERAVEARRNAGVNSSEFWDSQMVRALAVPGGDCRSLRLLRAAYLASWQVTLANHRTASPILSAALAKAAAGLERGAMNPAFMALVHRLERALLAQDACLGETESPPPLRHCERLGRGRFFRLRLPEFPEFGKLLIE